MTPFEEGEDDEDIIGSPHSSSSPHHKSQLSNEASTKKTYLGPMTRSHAKEIQQEVNVLLEESWIKGSSGVRPVGHGPD